LLTGSLEDISEPYSVAKIAGIKLCQGFKKQYGFNSIVAVPATIYGPQSDIDAATAHVISALIDKFTNAVKDDKKEIILWGTGNPKREFLYCDDFVDACIFLMNTYEGEEIINLGCGIDVSIKDLAHMIAEISGFKGSIIFDDSKPDGAMQKLLDNSRLTKLGWKAKIPLMEGIKKTYNINRQELI